MYTWFINLVGALPTDNPNNAQIVAYACSCIVTLFMIYLTFRLVFTLFKLIWGRL